MERKTPKTYNGKLQPIEKNPNPIDPRVDIGHVHLKTASLQRIHDFYVDILGFDVIAKMDTALFLSAGGYHHDLAFNTWHSANGTPAPVTSTGLYHVAIRYPTRASLADAVNRLQKANWPIEGTSDHGTHEAIYLADPDQNGLELYCDRPEAEWPIDENGHMALSSKAVDLESLLAELNQ